LVDDLTPIGADDRKVLVGGAVGQRSLSAGLEVFGPNYSLSIASGFKHHTLPVCGYGRAEVIGCVTRQLIDLAGGPVPMNGYAPDVGITRETRKYDSARSIGAGRITIDPRTGKESLRFAADLPVSRRDRYLPQFCAVADLRREQNRASGWG
jgi:hypothetical protein